MRNELTKRVFAPARVWTLAACGMAVLLGVGGAWAYQTPVPVGPPIVTAPVFPDLPVLDQDGNVHLFYTDLVKGKIVVLVGMYTRCPRICIGFGYVLSNLQQQLGSRLGQDVFLVSITTDPDYDTPARLNAWAAQFGRKPGWTLVTGTRANIGQLLSIVHIPVATGTMHAPIVYVGNYATGEWHGLFAFSGQVSQAINLVTKTATASGRTGKQ